MYKEYTIYQVHNENDDIISSIIDTAALIHQREKDSEEWLRWKYFGSPFGKSICVLALSKNNEIAAEVTFGQYQYVLNDKILKCLISYQTMVHPKHQKKGLFTLLTKEVISISQNLQIDIIFNFPNKASYSPFFKLKFLPINHLENRVYLYPKFSTLLSLPSIKNEFKANSIKEIKIDQLQLLEKNKEKIKPLKSEDILCPNHTFEFIKWRFFTFPMYDYRIVECKDGLAIIRIGNRGRLKEVQIMDFFPTDTFSRKFILSIKKEIKRKFNPHLLLVNLSSNHPAKKVVRKACFISLPHSINFFVFAINKKLEHFLNKESWVVTATEFHRY